MFQKWVLRFGGGGGHEVILVDWGIFSPWEWFAIT